MNPCNALKRFDAPSEIITSGFNLKSSKSKNGDIGIYPSPFIVLYFNFIEKIFLLLKFLSFFLETTLVFLKSGPCKTVKLIFLSLLSSSKKGAL